MRELATETRETAAEKTRLAENLMAEAESLERRAEACEEMADLSETGSPDTSASQGVPQLPATAAAVQYAAVVLNESSQKELPYREIAQKAIAMGYRGYNPGTAERTIANTFSATMRKWPDVFEESTDRPLHFRLKCEMDEALARLRARRPVRRRRPERWPQLIVAYLREHGPARWTDIVAHTGAPTTSITKTLQKPYFRAVKKGVWEVDEEAIKKLGEPE